MFGNQPNQGGGLFNTGGQQPTQAPGGLFGGNNMQNNQNQGSLFGGATQNKTPSFGGGGLFGGATQTPQTNTSTGLFSGIQPQAQQGGGLFSGATTQQSQGGGLFGQPQTQNNGLFGGQTTQPQQPGGIFNTPNTTGGMFGQSQPQGQGGLFGGNQQQGGGMFTKPNQQQGGGMFGQQNPQQGGGLFGQQQQIQAPQQGLFGGGQQQPVGQGMFGNQQQPNQTSFGQTTGTGLFGGQQQQQNQNKPGGLFGGQTQQTTVTGGLLPSTTTQSSLFPSTATSVWGGQQQPAQTYGQTQGFGLGTSNTNQLGGTSWGVNTLIHQQSMAQQQQTISNQPPITPVKSKNPKVDHKHSIKCISALDQYTGMSKQQIRCYYLLNGGAMPLGTPQTTTTTGGLWNKPSTTPATTSFTSLSTPQTGSMFSSKTTGTGLFGGGTTQPPASTFGTQQSTSLFGGQPAQTQGSSLFGGQPQQQGSLFGGQQQTHQQTQQQGGGLFGGQQTVFGGQTATQPQQTGSLFGQTQPQQQTGSLFGGQQQQAGSLFGGQPQPQGQGQGQGQGSSLFGQATQPQASSLFGQNNQATGSLFGGQTTQPAQSSLFGGQTTPQQNSSLFGNNPQPPTTGGLFGSNTGGGLFGQTTTPSTSGGLFGSQPGTGSLFSAINQPQQQQQTGLFGGSQSNQQFFSQPNPYASNISMLTSFPLQSNILSNQSILDPNYNKNSNNMLSVVLTALVSGGAISKNDADKLLKPTPFDQLVKKRQKQLQKQKQQQQIFTNIPSIFQDPINFKRFDVPDDYFQMRRSSGYWQRQKEKEQNDKKKFNIAYAPPKKKQKTTLPSLRQEGDDIQRAVKRSRNIQKHQLPIFNDEMYKLKPSLMRISMMTLQDSKQVQNVQIIGKYGKIRFLEPVSLFMKDIEDCIDIRQDTIDIKDPEWQLKKCQLTFINFGGYTNKIQTDQNKIISKMQKWIKKNEQDNMKLLQFDRQDGTLIVMIH